MPDKHNLFKHVPMLSIPTRDVNNQIIRIDCSNVNKSRSKDHRPINNVYVTNSRITRTTWDLLLPMNTIHTRNPAGTVTMLSW